MRFVLRFSIVNIVVNILYFGHFKLFLKTTSLKIVFLPKMYYIFIFFHIKSACS